MRRQISVDLVLGIECVPHAVGSRSISSAKLCTILAYCRVPRWSGRNVFVDTAAEDADAGGLCLVDHGVRVAAHRLQLAVGHDHGSTWKEIGYLGMAVQWCLRPLHVNREMTSRQAPQ